MGTQVDPKRQAVGPFKMGWILVMFDLPVGTKEEIRIATHFRRSLLDDGYVMMQFSVYMRSCADYERMQKHAKRLQIFTPSGGNVRAIFITDKQWEKSFNIISKSYVMNKKETIPKAQPQQFEFW